MKKAKGRHGAQDEEGPRTVSAGCNCTPRANSVPQEPTTADISTSQARDANATSPVSISTPITPFLSPTRQTSRTPAQPTASTPPAIPVPLHQPPAPRANAQRASATADAVRTYADGARRCQDEGKSREQLADEEGACRKTREKKGGSGWKDHSQCRRPPHPLRAPTSPCRRSNALGFVSALTTKDVCYVCAHYSQGTGDQPEERFAIPKGIY